MAATAPPIRAGAAFAGCDGPGGATGAVGVVIGLQVPGVEELHEPVPVGRMANVDEDAGTEDNDDDDDGGGGGGGGTEEEVEGGGGGGAELEVDSTAEIRLMVVVASGWVTVTTEASPAAAAALSMGVSKCAVARDNPFRAMPRRAILSCIVVLISIFFILRYIYIYI